MKCVVTGGAGFIGSFIVEELAKRGDEVVIYDVVRPEFWLNDNVTYFNGDTRYILTLINAMQGADEVYDIAGVLGTNELMLNNNLAVDVNVGGAINVLKAAKMCGVKRVLHPTKANDWLNTYTITKVAAEMFCQMFAKDFGVNVTILKWFNAYGPRQHIYPIRKAVPVFITQALLGCPLEVYGEGNQTIDLIYVKDIAKIAVEAIRKCGKEPVSIDVGSGVPITVKELARTIVTMAKSKSAITHVPMRKGEPEDSFIKASHYELEKKIGKFDFTPLDKGLFFTIEHYASLPKEELVRAMSYYRRVNKEEVILRGDI